MRPPAVAGSFYPDDPRELRSTIERLLAAVPAASDESRAYIVPHAGYRWSGPTAAHAYRRLEGRTAERVVLVGPAHRVALRGAAVPTDSEWSTPMGTVTLDTQGAGELVAAGLAVADDAPHAPEHSLEVQLPFLQFLGFSRVLPVCVGVAPVDAVAALLAAVAGPGSIVLCSTDLSHYLTQEQARAADSRTVAAIERLEPGGVGDRDACGRYALRGLLAWARDRESAVRVLHRATSGDEGGPRDRVVGYLAASLD
ncbi:AmmeMemoRadiSam system protein B [Dactylosporangium sp. NPDC049140]|uniref:AmmeMemoRadiSam system protein B n=1 Tax=Dactylosporangium sp. NPDC049140 TaxID=3155647 RepID=UPI0033F91E2D